MAGKPPKKKALGSAENPHKGRRRSSQDLGPAPPPLPDLPAMGEAEQQRLDEYMGWIEEDPTANENQADQQDPDLQLPKEVDEAIDGLSQSALDGPEGAPPQDFDQGVEDLSGLLQGEIPQEEDPADKGDKDPAAKEEAGMAAVVELLSRIADDLSVIRQAQLDEGDGEGEFHG